VRLSTRTAALFTLLLAVMTFHEAEHVVQIWQKDVASASCPNDCRGLLGFAFDLEWIHFAYNGSILLALGALVGFCRLWRNPPLVGALALQSYHMFEHVEKLAQWFANGGHSPTPGVLGMHIPLVELHFAFNTGVFLLVLTGYFTVGAHRMLWGARTPARVAAATTLLLFATASTAAAWTQRPPTHRLAAGVHDGPLVLDRAQRLIGEPGTVVRGGIVVTADDVVVRDLAVLGGENGIEVREARDVLLERVRVLGADLDGINVRLGSVTIRGCDIRSPPQGQGIDISFAHTLAPSLVQGCRISGGLEGIVSHLAHVRFRNNRVSQTSLRGIAVTEMSMGKVDGNVVADAVGIGIFCGDYSRCAIEDNRVIGTRPDPASPTGSRSGVGVVSHFGAVATLGENDLDGGAGAFAGARVEHD
jgi:nitrous oxidase accessory protein NosD